MAIIEGSLINPGGWEGARRVGIDRERKRERERGREREKREGR